jgi:beta-glucanase (GH16 family)
VATTAYPVGIADSSQPSGYAPPGVNALAGYQQSYVTNFTGSTLPSEWDPYEGQPGGDPGAQFDSAHVVVNNGVLQIKTYQDPAFNNEWVTGGTCLCNITSQTYGAYFVRSRLTGAGPTGVELLWPAGNTWPPEIDFNETYGDTSGTSATVHYTSANQQIQRTVSVDMTQWHTWGVIWTPTSITYTVDGNVWGQVTNSAAIPNGPMYISLQSQTWCSSNWACPTTPQSMLVDWVAQYKAN